MDIVIATTNMYKMREIKRMLSELLEGLDIDILSLYHFPEYKAPLETGKTFVENAELKALSAAKTLNRLVIADDSGLVVPALGGEPGILSARYAGEKATDQDNRNKLKQKLETLKEEERIGDFVCALSIATSNSIIKTSSSFTEGTLLTKEQGGGGFGYEPLFMKNDYRSTFAELAEDVKNRISHRRKAFDKLSNDLLKYCEQVCTT